MPTGASQEYFTFPGEAMYCALATVPSPTDLTTPMPKIVHTPPPRKTAAAQGVESWLTDLRGSSDGRGADGPAGHGSADRRGGSGNNRRAEPAPPSPQARSRDGGPTSNAAGPPAATEDAAMEDTGRHRRDSSQALSVAAVEDGTLIGSIQ